MIIRRLILTVVISLSAVQAQNRGTPIGWLRSQIDPATGLVQSYSEKPGYWLYGQCLAIIAFTEAGGQDAQHAKKMLEFYRKHQTNPASDEAFWPFSVSGSGKLDMGYRTTATNAWLVMAINYYEAKTGDREYAEMADHCLRWITRRTLHEFDDGAAVSMADEDQSSTNHDETQVFSTEHQLDAVSAFVYRYHLTGEREFLETGLRIRDFIKSRLWDGERIMGGYREDNGVNDAYYLDANCWGVLALGDWIEPGMWINEDRLVVSGRSLALNGKTVSDVKGYTEWHGSEHYWTEGTESMVCAWIMLGNEEKAAEYHEETRRFAEAVDRDPFDDRLGIPYACDRTEHTSKSESVAGTTWFYYNEKRINPFRPPVRLRR